MTTTLAAISGHDYWTIALVIGLVAALIVATLLTVLIITVRSIERSVDGLLDVAGGVGANTDNTPHPQRPRRCWGKSSTKPSSRTGT